MCLYQKMYPYLACIAASIFLSACQSAKVNKVSYDLPSPQGTYHVEVKQCRANDAMFGPPTQLQVSILQTGKTENCRALIHSINQFIVYGLDQPLHLQWQSETELLAIHPRFGPSSSTYQLRRNTDVKISFATSMPHKNDNISAP